MIKKIEGYIQPSKLDALKDALVEVGITGMSISQVQGFGRQRGYHQGEEKASKAKFLEKTKIEIVVDEEIVEDIVQIIMDMARTGNIGAGKIFVLPVEDAIRIGSGEVGSAAIH